MVSFTSDAPDGREDHLVGERVMAFVEKHEALSVFVAEEVLGCAHEEGVDYPVGAACPACPFWAERDRWGPVKDRLAAARGELLSRAVAAVKAETEAEAVAEAGTKVEEENG
jgi:hypothetical protein